MKFFIFFDFFIKDKSADLSAMIEEGFGPNGLGIISISSVNFHNFTGSFYKYLLVDHLIYYLLNLHYVLEEWFRSCKSPDVDKVDWLVLLTDWEWSELVRIELIYNGTNSLKLKKMNFDMNSTKLIRPFQGWNFGSDG